MTGHLLVFKFRQGQLRHQLKHKLEHSIPREELTYLKIPQSWFSDPPGHFQVIKKNEFRLNGQMFDIVHREAENDTLYLYCLADEAETLLFARLDEWVAQQNTNDPFQRGQRLQWERLLDSLFQVSVVAFPPSEFPDAKYQLPPYRFSWQTWEQEAVNPPPEA